LLVAAAGLEMHSDSSHEVVIDVLQDEQAIFTKQINNANHHIFAFKHSIAGEWCGSIQTAASFKDGSGSSAFFLRRRD
jgi:hypothetical protein